MRAHGQLLLICLFMLLASSSASAGEPTGATSPGKNPVQTNSLLAQFRSGPMAQVKEIVFAARPVGDDPHWYANFSYYAHNPNRKAYCKGAKLYSLNLASGRLRTLLADSAGGIRDPQVHYDGQKILFSYRPGGSDNYHLYEIAIDGTGLRQLTFGEYDDIEPSYLSDGSIVFVSSRCRRWVNCWLTQVAVLYRCNEDGSEIRPISSNNEHDNTPWPLPDGRILYTRWEYVDRSQVHYHHLWTTAPDGTGQTVYFGNYHPGVVMIDAKPIPGSGKVVASFSPGHGLREHMGYITVVDPIAGPDENAFAKRITPEPDYRDPWAFSEESFLAAKGTSLFLLDSKGKKEILFTLPKADIDAKFQCHEPRPLILRVREPLIPARVDLQEPTGQMILANVYDGRNMSGVKPGEIKKLLVLETLPMPIHYTGGWEPISLSGTFTLERILGTVPVAEDGSASFEVPALRSVFFVALDENENPIKRMQSFTTVQPGETIGCVGCHESRTQPAPQRNARLAALKRPPSTIQPITDVPDVFDFPRDIQPILDRHCLRCHDFDQNNTNGIYLSGDRGPIYSQSYYTVTACEQVADGRNRPKSEYPPRTLGSSASPLMAKLTPKHYGVEATPHERKMVRLWIESGAPYAGTYAALGCGMIGYSIENQGTHQDLQWPSTTRAAEVVKKRCAECHNGPARLPSHITDHAEQQGSRTRNQRLHFSRHALFNLTRPDKSLLLLAPLAPEAGGFGFCQPGKSNSVFANTNDADYRVLRAALADAAGYLEENKRFDMPGFKPRVDWVREMKRYGALRADWVPANEIDVYAVERDYWKSFWYSPQK